MEVPRCSFKVHSLLEPPCAVVQVDGDCQLLRAARVGFRSALYVCILAGVILSLFAGAKQRLFWQSGEASGPFPAVFLNS